MPKSIIVSIIWTGRWIRSRSVREINESREALIAQALSTEEGRISLSQAMVEPIRRQLNYEAIGRRLLMVDELPQVAYANYQAQFSVLTDDSCNSPIVAAVISPSKKRKQGTGPRFFVL